MGAKSVHVSKLSCSNTAAKRCFKTKILWNKKNNYLSRAQTENWQKAFTSSTPSSEESLNSKHLDTQRPGWVIESKASESGRVGSRVKGSDQVPSLIAMLSRCHTHNIAKTFCSQRISAISALDVSRRCALQIYILLTYLLTYLLMTLTRGRNNHTRRSAPASNPFPQHDLKNSLRSSIVNFFYHLVDPLV